MVTANHLIEVSKAVSCFSFIDMKVFFLSKTFYFLAEQLLPIPEVRGLNPVISRALY